MNTEGVKIAALGILGILLYVGFYLGVIAALVYVVVWVLKFTGVLPLMVVL